MLRRLAAIAMGLALGCSSGGNRPLPLVWVGTGIDYLPASTAGNVFWVEADVDGVPGPDVILDTGAPVALLNPPAFAGTVPEGSGRVATLTLGSTTFWKVPTVGISAPVERAPNGKAYGGIVGFSVFGQFSTAFDYRGDQVVIGDAPLPAAVDPAGAGAAILLEGGGQALLPDGTGVPLAASRVIVPVAVEGATRSLLLDTGASWVALRRTLFDQIVADGRALLDADVTTVSGEGKAQVARLRSVVALGQEVAGAVSGSSSSVDGLLDTLSAEVGHRVDGMLGATFLREFYVRVDYPNAWLALHRYATRDHILDDYHRVGITLAPRLGGGGTTYVVAGVYPGTDAQKQGIVAGEDLLSVDGRSLASLDPISADQSLIGAVGSSHELAFADRTLRVVVDELLPLP